jgi:hypothetical protein
MTKRVGPLMRDIAKGHYSQGNGPASRKVGASVRFRTGVLIAREQTGVW